MMFYLIPPRTRLDLSTFHDNIISRFKDLLEATNTNNYDGIIEKFKCNNEMDQIGHFLLRCFCAYTPDMKEFIVKLETDLFSRRLQTLSWNEKKKACESVMEQISELTDFKLFDPIRECKIKSYFNELLCSTLHNMCEALLISQIGRHFSVDCDTNCKKYFQKDRSVNPQSGFAFVPCSMWNSLLVELFRHHYEFGLFVTANTVLPYIISDMRWTSAFDRLGKIYSSFKTNTLFSPRTRLTAGQIDQECSYFPPCMAHLLKVLRTQHRLSHNWRYRFSLFLKDIGLNFEESVEFWKTEYLKSCTPESSCTHSWQANHRKYMYSIRHLYGLVGTKVEKKPKDCAEYQTMLLGMREEGGCPFVHFDGANFLKSFSNELGYDVNVIDEIMRLKMTQEPLKACYIYRAARAKILRLQVPPEKFESPVEYYRSMKLCKESCLDW